MTTRAPALSPGLSFCDMLHVCHVPGSSAIFQA